VKKRVARIVVAVFIVTVVFVYNRASYLASYSRLSHYTGIQSYLRPSPHTSIERSIFHTWAYSESDSHFKVWQWARIRWDFWCIGLPARLDKPRIAGDRILVHVKVTDRTDTEFLYVFDREWNLINIVAVPLA